MEDFDQYEPSEHSMRFIAPNVSVSSQANGSHPMNVDIVTVCVNYADFLAETLPTLRLLNAACPGKHIVVTTPTDDDTRRVCEYNGVACLTTYACYQNDAAFNKAAMINAALSECTGNNWILHVDADIALPPLAGPMLAMMELDRASLYGVDRFNFTGAAAWDWFRLRGKPPHEHRIFCHPPQAEMGVRVVRRKEGWYPIGYFQLWHPDSGVVSYVEQGDGADRSDMAHACRFAEINRRLIAKFFAYHLESEQAVMGANWFGRKTRPFRELS